MKREDILKEGSRYANRNWNVSENPNEHDNAKDDFIAGAIWMLNELSKAPEKEEEKWISVEDELPKTGIPVVIYGINDYGKGRRLRAFYAPKFSIDADSYEGDADYSEEKDEYFIPEGWYEQNEYEHTNWYVGFKPTHWQPLPTPPKE